MFSFVILKAACRGEMRVLLPDGDNEAKALDRALVLFGLA
jgi:hypothetical protein